MNNYKKIGFVLLSLVLLLGFVNATSCTNEWLGGSCIGSITYTHANTLTNNVNASGSITINSGAVITSVGYNFWIAGNFNNQGTIVTGVNSLTGGQSNAPCGDQGGFGSNGIYIQAVNVIAGNIVAVGGTPPSQNNNCAFGGGGGGFVTIAYNAMVSTANVNVIAGSGSDTFGLGIAGFNSGNGGNTLANGGSGQTTGSTCVFSNADNGITPSAPTITNALIQTWYNGGSYPTFPYYFAGAGGGGMAYTQDGTNGASFIGSYAGSGGGGGNNCNINNAGSGYGGNGQVSTFLYTIQPLKSAQVFPTNTPSLTALNTLLDSGQLQVLTGNWLNGLAPFTVNFFNVTGNAVFNTLTNVNSPITNSFIVNSPTQNNGFTWNFIVIDAEPLTVNSLPITFGVNAIMKSLTFVTSNDPINYGQIQTLTATLSGGTSSYTYNYFVYNSQGLVYNSPNLVSATTTNIISFTQLSNWGSGIFTANLIVIDSATTSTQVTNSLTYNAQSTSTTSTSTTSSTTTSSTTTSTSTTTSSTSSTAPTTTSTVFPLLNETNLSLTNPFQIFLYTLLIPLAEIAFDLIAWWITYNRTKNVAFAFFWSALVSYGVYKLTPSTINLLISGILTILYVMINIYQTRRARDKTGSGGGSLAYFYPHV